MGPLRSDGLKWGPQGGHCHHPVLVGSDLASVPSRESSGRTGPWSWKSSPLPVGMSSPSPVSRAGGSLACHGSHLSPPRPPVLPATRPAGLRAPLVLGHLSWGTPCGGWELWVLNTQGLVLSGAWAPSAQEHTDLTPEGIYLCLCPSPCCPCAQCVREQSQEVICPQQGGLGLNPF